MILILREAVDLFIEYKPIIPMIKNGKLLMTLAKFEIPKIVRPSANL
jgi:hypothetical protein